MKSFGNGVWGLFFLFACTAPSKEAPKEPIKSVASAPVSAPAQGASLSPVSAPASLPAPGRGPLANGEALSEWILERVANAKAGSPELVRVPLSYVVGWGCDCPAYQIGFAGYEGAEFNLWAKPKLAPGVKLPAFPEYVTDPDNPGGEKQWAGAAAVNWLVVAEGSFTGKTTKYKNEDEDYILSEFEVLRYRLWKGQKDHHFELSGEPEDNPDAYAYVLLSGEEMKKKSPPLKDKKSWLLMAGSFPLSSAETPAKAEALTQKLLAAGFPAESFDSRSAARLFCCYQVVVAGRYASETEAKTALVAVQKLFPDAYLKQGL
jgi:hypothetical protein